MSDSRVDAAGLGDLPCYAHIAGRIAGTGLTCRGGFIPVSSDGLHNLLPGGVAAVVLVGDLGGRFWPKFAAERRDEADPLDNWSRRVLNAAARDLDALAIFPFDGPPHWPFQQWAMRAEGLQRSPIGPLIHPEVGLWHGYRGALLFDREIDLPAPGPAPCPCDRCDAKPCLTACPVGAFADGDFEVAACLAHVTAPDGAPCMSGGCLARRACPVGTRHTYAADYQAFLADGFVRAFAE